MKKKLLMVVLLTLVAVATEGQEWLGLGAYDPTHFEGLKAEGAVPTDLRNSLEELYGLDKKRVKDYNDGRLRNRDRVLGVSYNITKLVTSGRIVYGDPLSRLAGRIADTLLKDYPDLRQELRFYTIKSPEVNAFSTGQGMIFICTGLMARVDNEAELAFVIAHEIIHYYSKHQLETVSCKRGYSDDVEADSRELRDFIKYHNRSREMELEADSLGLTLLYKGSPYASDAVDHTLDMLQYGRQPYAELPLERSLFDVPGYSMPNGLFLEQVNPVLPHDDDNDTLSTHPNIGTRRKACKRLMDGRTGGQEYVLTEAADFARLRTLARMECIRQELIYQDYPRAFYDSRLLLKEDPDSRFGWKGYCHALYALARHKTAQQSGSMVADHKNMEGEVQEYYYFFRRIEPEDMALVAARQLWLTHKRLGNEREVEYMLDGLLGDVQRAYHHDADYFEPQYRDTVAATPHDTTARLSARERMLRRKKEKKGDGGRRYAFVGLMDDGTLAQRLSLAKDTVADTVALMAKNHTQMVYAPQYIVVDTKGEKIEYLKSAKAEANLYGYLQEAAARAGYGSLDFSDQSLHSMSTAEQYNDWMTLNEWMAEYHHKGCELRMSTQPQMERMGKIYGMGSVNSTMVANYHVKNFVQSLYAFFFVPLAPFAVFHTLFNTDRTLVVSEQVDAKSGRRIKKDTYDYDLKDDPALVRGSLYSHYALLGDTAKGKGTGYMGGRVAGRVGVSMGINGMKNREKAPKSIYNLGVTPRVDLETEFAAWEHSSLALQLGWMPFAYLVDKGWHEYDISRQNDWSAALTARFYLGRGCFPSGPWMGVGAVANLFEGDDLPIGGESHEWKGGLTFQTGRNFLVGNHLSVGLFTDYRFTFVSLIGSDEERQAINMRKFVPSLLRIGVSVGLLP